ncbi:MAG: hypothetical protein KDA28_06565, partial [Phycisphaerales bacterium]|nr:hypothetical protein [Phycisphaerales bacterium]
CSHVRKANSALVAALVIVARRTREAASRCEIRGLGALVVDLIEIHRVGRLLESSGVRFA